MVQRVASNYSTTRKAILDDTQSHVICRITPEAIRDSLGLSKSQCQALIHLLTLFCYVIHPIDSSAMASSVKILDPPAEVICDRIYNAYDPCLQLSSVSDAQNTLLSYS